jgi:hypothetical protein
MALIDDIKWLNDEWADQQATLDHNAVLFDIFEGSLLPYVLEDLQAQLSPDSFKAVKHRVPPINVLQSIVGKLSQIYNEPPARELDKGVEADKEALGKLIAQLDIDTEMTLANEFCNLFKRTFVEPYIDNGNPAIRSVPSDRFIVASRNQANPMRPTHYMKYMGKTADDEKIFHAYTDTEFLIFTDKGTVLRGEMASEQNAEGVNPYGKIPGVYINRSRHRLSPRPDTDTMAMTRLIPVLLADLNFAVMFQSFSIVYGIDVDDENLKRSPNAFWRFKSNPSNPDAKPQVGVIKPEVDTDKGLTLIRSLMSMWMETRNIKPGAMGDATVENAASGIAKMIDEADTSADRTKQIKFFAPAEAALLELIVNNMHPVWLNDTTYQFRERFPSTDVKITTRFPIQKAVQDASKVIDDEIKKLEQELTTRERAIQAINPDMSSDGVKKLIDDIGAQRDDDNKPKSELDENGVPIVVKPGTPSGADIRKETLNGAQVDSVVTLVQSVATGALPRDAAVGIISMSFNLETADAETMLGSVGNGFVPKAPQVDKDRMNGGEAPEDRNPAA